MVASGLIHRDFTIASPLPTVAVGVKERIDWAILLQPVPKPVQQTQVACEAQCQSFILFEGISHEFGKPNRSEQACGDPSRERLASAGHQWQSGPQRVARGGVSAVWQGIEKQVGVTVARQMIGHWQFWRKDQPLGGNPTGFGLPA